MVVDEEQENSYKQDKKPRYNARDLALMRAKITNSIVILGSATPSIESYYNAMQKKYKLLELKNRIFNQSPPSIKIIDMRKEKGEIFSKELIQVIKTKLELKEQIILLLNRKGYSTFFLCKDCGNVLLCKNCNISLVYYQKNKVCKCHYCNYTKSVPEKCPKCESKNVNYFGMGTEKIESLAKKLFPESKIARLDKDIISKKGNLEKILNLFHENKIDILIGTQIVAKGLNFPNVTLVGIISADTSLNLPDFRSEEKTFQLLTQVTGRTGRGEKLGETFIQTFNPEIESIVLTGDYYSFYQKEIFRRKQLLYPPFRKIIKIDIQGIDENKIQEIAIKIGKIIMANIKEKTNINILGPAPSPIFKIKKRFRYQIILLGENSQKLHEIVMKSLPYFPTSYKIDIDVDPVMML
ncbi:MAG: primosomal protein N' [bacterium]